MGCKNNEIVDTFSQAMQALFDKYIDPDKAPLEINISSRKRMHIQSVLTKHLTIGEMQNVLEVMESAVDEVIGLLTGAAMRFAMLEHRKEHGDTEVETKRYPSTVLTHIQAASFSSS